MSKDRKPLLIFSDTIRSADLFYSIPLHIGDPFSYFEIESRKIAINGVLERDRILSLETGIEVIDPVALGIDDLIASGKSGLSLRQEITLRACKELNVKEASIPPDFPVAIADFLRAGGVDLEVDLDRFTMRRRVKTKAQLDGIRRAQRAADDAMAQAARLIRELPAGLTSEQVREAMKVVCREQGTILEDDAIVASGAQGAVGHESGHGPISAGDPVIVDIWPKDAQTQCFADMTRTFVAGGGEPPAELADYWRLCRESLDEVFKELRPGASCADLFELSCEPFHHAGQPTLLNKKKGEPLDHGFLHGLGHGVGLELHEAPSLGSQMRGTSEDTLISGDVITVEPGCYRPGFGGCRLEDLIVITEDGYENLTNFPYDL
jgi:Xaa-Pro aminopeptidase